MLPAQRKHPDKGYDVAVPTRPVHGRSAHGEQRLKVQVSKIAVFVLEVKSASAILLRSGDGVHQFSALGSGQLYCAKKTLDGRVLVCHVGTEEVHP